MRVFDEARACYVEVLRLSPIILRPLGHGKRRCCRRTGCRGEEVLAKAIKTGPRRFGRSYDARVLFLLKGDFVEEEVRLTQALRLDSSNADAC